MLQESNTYKQTYIHTLRKYIPKVATINLQHTPLNIQCLGISMSHPAAVFLLNWQFPHLSLDLFNSFLLSLLFCFLNLLTRLLSFVLHSLFLFFLPVSTLSYFSLPFLPSTSGLAVSGSLRVNVDSLFCRNTRDLAFTPACRRLRWISTKDRLALTLSRFTAA